MTYATMILVLMGATMAPCDGADRLAGLVDDVLLAWSEEEMHLWGIGTPWDRAEDELPPVHLCEEVTETFRAVGASRREERPPVLLPSLVHGDFATGGGAVRSGAPVPVEDSPSDEGRDGKSPSAAAPVVPEPLTCTMLVLGGGALLRRR